MAELSEVLALRMESHDQQRREVTQLRTQVLKLQRRCQSVRLGVCMAPSFCPGPHKTPAPFFLPWPHGALSSTRLIGPSLWQSQSRRRSQ